MRDNTLLHSSGQKDNDIKHPQKITLQAYVDGVLSGSALDQMRVHLTDCAACRGTVGDLEDAKMSIRGLRGVELPGTFASEIAAAIRTKSEQEAEWSIIEKTAEKMLTGIAIVVIFLLVASNVFGDEAGSSDVQTSGLLEVFIRDTTVVRIVTAESLTRDDILAAALTREEGTTP